MSKQRSFALLRQIESNEEKRNRFNLEGVAEMFVIKRSAKCFECE